MLRHYLTAACRQLWRNRLATAFNLIGLVIGLACFALSQAAISFISGRATAGNFNHVFALTEEVKSLSLQPLPFVSSLTAYPLMAELPPSALVAREAGPRASPVQTGTKKLYLSAEYGDPDLLRIFPLDGIAPGALDAPTNVILTEQTAIKLFGTLQVVGRQLTLNNVNCAVVGVISDQPATAPLGSFDLLASFYVNHPPNDPHVAWGLLDSIVYLKLPPSMSLGDLNTVLEGFADRHVDSTKVRLQFGAIPGNQIFLKYLNAELRSDTTGVSILLVLGGIGAVILAVAIANYINLATAQILPRAREIRIRGILGATRKDLLLQHATETALLVICAAGLLIVAVLALLPVIYAASGADMDRLVVHDPAFWASNGIALLVTIVVAGVYPALLFAARRFSGSPAVAGNATRGWVRPLLTSLQFTTAATLLILALVLQAENRTLRALNQDGSSVVSIDTHEAITADQIKNLRAALSAIPQVRDASAAGLSPWSGNTIDDKLQRGAVSPAAYQVMVHQIDTNYFHTLHIGFLAGRDFSPLRGDPVPASNPTDPNVIIDRALAVQMGFSNAEKVLGQVLYPAADAPRQHVRYHVIGVVETHPTELLTVGSSGGSIFYYAPQNVGSILLRLDPMQIPRALTAINAAWDQCAPQLPLKLDFIDDLFNAAYRVPQNINLIVSTLVVLALLMSLAGLAAMATQIARIRLREIAIRKMLGASGARATALLLWEFAKPLLVANMLAWPIGFAAARFYLSLFVQRAALSPLPFMISLAATLLIAGIIVSGETFRAARISPADVLRYE